ncbi:hypothetical protein ACFWIR_18960, partial [Streptomyces olivaceus]
MSAGTGGRGELFADGTDGDRTAAAAAVAVGGKRGDSPVQLCVAGRSALTRCGTGEETGRRGAEG